MSARLGLAGRLAATFIPSQLTPLLIVPAQAIQRHGQVSSVYVVQNGVATLRLIRVGATSSEGVEVVAGLDAGESIVVSPLTGLADGVNVTVGNPPTGTGGAS